MISDQDRHRATEKAIGILIDSLSAEARALLRRAILEKGVALPERGKPEPPTRR